MSISLQIEGLEEVRAYLNALIVELESDDFWDQNLGEIAEEARRFAALISPAVTGSYQGAHRIVVGRRQAALSIDPTARNTKSGVLVSQYAEAVEKKHRVYARTDIYIHRLAIGGAERMGRRLVHGY